VEVRIEIEGLDAREQALVRLVAATTDLRLFWPRLVPLFVSWMREQFDSEGDWGGEHWAPLTEPYATTKALAYPGKGILYATGDLRMAASLPVRHVTASTLELVIDDSGYKHGGNVARSVGPYHQEGTDSMVARPILPDILPAEAQLQVHEAADAYVDELVDRLGLR